MPATATSSSPNMAPGNERYPLLKPPFVTKGLLQEEDRFINRLVRVVGKVVDHDLYSACVETYSGEYLHVVLVTAWTKGKDGQLKPVELEPAIYVLTCVAKYYGGLLLLARPPEKVPDDGLLKVVNDAVDFMNDVQWLSCEGHVPADPSMHHDYEGKYKPYILQLVEDAEEEDDDDTESDSCMDEAEI